MLPDNLKNKKVLVVGLGRSGVSVANLLHLFGANVSVSDSRGEGELTGSLSMLKGNPNLFLGGHESIDLSFFDLAVASPGVSRGSSILVGLEKKEVDIIGELEFASRYVEKPIIAITGTNGKTTTSTLVRDMLVAGGKKVFLGGNIGLPLSEYLLGKEDADYLVCEVSTFQMEWSETFHPYISTILNISEDHLDRHADMEEYIGLKKRVYANQGERDHYVINLDDPATSFFKPPSVVAKHFFSRKVSTVTDIIDGSFQFGEDLLLSGDGVTRKICTVKDLKIKGVHNIENVLAAASIANICGISAEDIKSAAISFKGVANRMEFVDSVGGITFINDSKGTNVGAAVGSIKSIDTPLILIAGGKDKGGNYTPLMDVMKDKVKEVILIGEAAERMFAFVPQNIHQIRAASLEEAVTVAYERGKSGDTVLLSPACSSFDMFKSYEERGNKFREAVSSLEKGRQG